MSDVISDVKKSLKHKNYHHWAHTADDGMNKSLKFIIYLIYNNSLNIKQRNKKIFCLKYLQNHKFFDKMHINRSFNASF